MGHVITGLSLYPQAKKCINIKLIVSAIIIYTTYSILQNIKSTYSMYLLLTTYY